MLQAKDFKNNGKKHGVYYKDLLSYFKFSFRRPLTEEDMVALYQEYKHLMKDTSCIKVMCMALCNLSNHNASHLNQASDLDIYNMFELLEHDLGNGYNRSALAKYGIDWVKRKEFWDFINHSFPYETTEEPTTKQPSFKEMLLNGSILERLEQDVPDMDVLDLYTYKEFIEGAWRMYPGCTFGIKGNYRLELVATGVLAFESMYNNMLYHYPLTPNVGFRLMNVRTEKILKIESYSDLKRTLLR